MQSLSVPKQHNLYANNTSVVILNILGITKFNHSIFNNYTALVFKERQATGSNH